MNIKNVTIAAAIGSLLAVGTAQANHHEGKDAKVKCYGVAKAGKNDCATASHSCAGRGEDGQRPDRMEVRCRRPNAKRPAARPARRQEGDVTGVPAAWHAAPACRARPIPARAGIGLRSQHHAAILTASPAPAWIEAHTENYFHDGGPAVRALERARSLYPLSLHGVGLGLGSADPLDRDHLARVRDAVRRFEPALVSEHACWGHVDGEHFNDLLPLPYTEEAVDAPRCARAARCRISSVARSWSRT